MMKRSKLPKLLFILLLIGVIFFPWGAGEKKEEVPPPPPVKSSEAARQDQTPSEDLIWGDVPIYPGASRSREEMATPILETARADYKKVEHRCYQTADAGEKVASFYDTEMPKRGWKKVMSMDFKGESFLVSWHRHSGEIRVTITTLERKEDGKLGLVVVRGHQKK
jgi:hypothetical protein